MLTWNDLRLFVIAKRSSSLREVASEMRMDETTVSRRLKAIERTIGMPLFMRKRGGLGLTPQALLLAAHAERMEQAALDLRLAATELTSSPDGIVRVSAPPTLARFAVAPAIATLRQSAPKLSIDLETDPSNIRIEEWEADIALRLGFPATSGSDVIVRKIGIMAYAVYEAQSRDTAGGWIGYPKKFLNTPEAAWVESRLDGETPALRTNDPVVMAEAVKAGVARALLPLILGQGYSGITQIGPTILNREVWLLRRAETVKSSIVQMASDQLYQLIGKTLLRQPND